MESESLRAIERWERFLKPRHLAADGRLPLDHHHLVAGIRDIEGRLDAGNSAADDQCPAGDGTRWAPVQCCSYLFDRQADELTALSVACARSGCTQEQCSRMLAISTDKDSGPPPAPPSKGFACACAGSRKPPRRRPGARRRSFAHHRLARVRAHVPVVHGATHAGKLAPLASVTSSTSTVRGDVFATPANEDPDPGHAPTFPHKMPVNAQLLGLES